MRSSVSLIGHEKPISGQFGEACGSNQQTRLGRRHPLTRPKSVRRLYHPPSRPAATGDNATTTAFRHRISVDGNTLRYDETTMVDIYGKQFEHTDANELRRAE